MRYRIIRMNLMMILPLLILFSSASLTAIYSLMRSSTVDLLLSESHNSQLYLMEQLSHRWNLDEQKRELRAAAGTFCKTLSDSLNVRVQIYSDTQELIGDSGLTSGFGLTDDVAQAVSGTKAYTFFVTQGRPYISFSSPIYSGNLTVGAVRYLAFQEDMGLVRNFSLLLVVITLLVGIICFIMSIFIANSFTRPILDLKDSVRKVEEDMSLPLENIDCSDGEILELEQAFRSMREANLRNIRRLAQEKEKQNLFFNSATHQLKTPLTSIIGYSEIIQRISQNEDVVLSGAYIEQAGKDLLEVVEDIIDISRFQKTEYEFKPEWFLLNELCDECAELLSPRLQRCGISISNLCGGLSVYFDRQRVREVILNVLDNSILHSGGTCITITSGSMPLRVMIKDNGKGLDPGQLKRLFEPFYRPAKSPSGGSGLGLSICKGIMTAQGGDIDVTSQPGKGMEVTLYFQSKNGKDSQPHHMARRI
ncbi:MAG: HAMP domain-containing sensor histidine kinase [Angelakisella sp.]|nr:HAMP domain-containing sensor histidine kinase [Angelakisella sp.]